MKMCTNKLIKYVEFDFSQEDIYGYCEVRTPVQTLMPNNTNKGFHITMTSILSVYCFKKSQLQNIAEQSERVRSVSHQSKLAVRKTVWSFAPPRDLCHCLG